MKKYYVKKPVVASSKVKIKDIFIPSASAGFKKAEKIETTINFFLLNIFL